MQTDPIWIEIQTALPEVDKAVLVCLSNNGINKGFLNKSGRWSVLFAEGISSPNPKNPVTHWTFLPEPPQK